MTRPACSDEYFVELFEAYGATETCRRLGMTSEKNIYARRRNLERKLGRPIDAPTGFLRHSISFTPTKIPGILNEELLNGCTFVGSDAHYWPGYIPTAHKAMVKLAKELKPKIIVKNGDDLDFPRISRHPPINWEELPKVHEEIEVCQERGGEIIDAAPKAKRYWPLGNHDARFEIRLAQENPEYARVHGVHLHDHFPLWEPCWGLKINSDVVAKHRWKGGIHAPYNNTVQSGVTMVTGHLHSQKVYPYTDYNGDRWGVDAGMMADVYGPQFQYMEGNPRNWRSGFAILTFHKGILLQPELVKVCGEGLIDFRGKVIRV